MLNKYTVNNMKTEMMTTILKEELVNDDSLLQWVQRPDNRVFLRCRYISAEGTMDEDIIHEFTEENREQFQVFQTERYIAVFDTFAQSLSRLYHLDLHYNQIGGFGAKCIYDSELAQTEGMQVDVEPDTYHPTFKKMNLPKMK